MSAEPCLLPDPAAFASALEAWFARSGRDYPWRRTRDPYAVLVSEIMLQQTQIATVLERGYYTRWLERFPDFATLAAASEEEILRAWEGLGYYRRARNLQKLAQVVVSDHGGQMPEEPGKIVSLPGIGPYTAGAVASFAFGLPEPIVDGNVARVLSRVCDDATPVDSREGSQRLWRRAGLLVRAAGDPRAFNSALMELGQTLCHPGKPDCTACPVRDWCAAADPAALPVKQARAKLTEVTERVFFLHTDAGVLLERETGSRRTGLWKLPALPDADEPPHPPVLLRSKYGITRYKVTLWVHAAPAGLAPDPAVHQSFQPHQLPDVPMPSPYRRALEAALRAEDFSLET